MGVIVDAFPEWAGLPQMEKVQADLKKIDQLARSEWTNLRVRPSAAGFAFMGNIVRTERGIVEAGRADIAIALYFQ